MTKRPNTHISETEKVYCVIMTSFFNQNTFILFLECSYFRSNYESVWNELKLKIAGFSPTDVVYICDFIINFDRHSKVLLVLGGLTWNFNNETNILINRFISSAVDKIHKLFDGKPTSDL